MVQGALDTFMSIVVHRGKEFLEKGGTGQDVEAPLECHQAINKGQRAHALIGCYFCFDRNQRGVLVMGLTEAIDEIETWSEDSEDHGFLYVIAGQRVGHGVGVASLVLDLEIEAEQLAHPMVLPNG